jgi:hypothetical protein
MRAEAAGTAGYHTYIGYDEYPDLAGSPDDYSASLPAALNPTLPSAGNTTDLHVVTRAVNSFGIESANTYPTVIKIDENGDAVLSDMTTPEIVNVVGIGNNGIRLFVRYNGYGIDTDPGNTWRVYASTTGAPDPDTDTAVASFNIVGATAQIDIGPYNGGDVVQLALVVYRTADGEQSTADTFTFNVGAIPDNPVPVPVGIEETDYDSYETFAVYEDADNYVMVNSNENSMTFHVGGATGAVLYTDELRCSVFVTSAFDTEQTMTSVVEFHGGEIWIGLGSPLKRVMTINSSGTVTVSSSDIFSPVAKAGISDYVEYDTGVPATDLSIDLSTVHARLTPITIGGIQNAILKVGHINTIY